MTEQQETIVSLLALATSGPQYGGNFTCKEDLEENFYKSEGTPSLEDCAIIAAHYENEDYDGDAFVLALYDGKMYEVHGSHCSCYGLEEQWCPEETNLQALLFRWSKGKPYGAEAKVREFFKALLPE